MAPGTDLAPGLSQLLDRLVDKLRQPVFDRPRPKGSTTVVADPGGAALAVTTGDARLATAGTGDVLSGVLGALLAMGLEPLHAAAAAAWLHGRASTLGPARGLVASDLPDLLPAAYESLEHPDDGQQLARP